MAERQVLVGVPVAGRQLDCKTVFAVEAWTVDKQDWALGRAAGVAVAGIMSAVVAAVEG